jgi:tetratricopeptide (TPR) repeat protein
VPDLDPKATPSGVANFAPSLARRPKVGVLPTLLAAVFPGVTRRRVMGFAGLAALTTLLMWASPFSPTALGQADAALGLGSPEIAAARYDRIAAVNPFPWVRDEALYRGAMVYAFDLNDPIEARHRLEKLARHGPEDVLYAQIEEQIGQLLLRGEARPDEASRAFLAAYEAAPHDAAASGRLVAAARARREAGDLAEADKLWKRVAARFPELQVDALIARAELALAHDDAEAALALYETAVPAATTPDQVALSRLGAATCLERLGNIEAALAEIDTADVPADVRESRAKALRARLGASASAPEAREKSDSGSF